MSRRRAAKNDGDITLNDFANAFPTRASSRLKKSLTNTKQLASTSDDVLWFDKDLEEFDVDTHPEEALAVDRTYTVTERHHRRRRRKTTRESSEYSSMSKRTGNEYPLHVWFLLSEYIRPEGVVSFSCICRGACAAVRSPRFWITLYRRYYDPETATAKKIPERLTPTCMERPRGLRACVVRTLFFVYPPFVARTLVTHGVDRLSLPAYCVLAWHSSQSDKSHVDFHFKFRSNFRLHLRTDSITDAVDDDALLSESSRLPDLLEMLCDVDANEEHGCRVLKVTCPNYIWIPAVMGMFLTSVQTSTGVGDKPSRQQRLGLTFSRNAYRRPSRTRDEDDVTIMFESASSVRLLDWWHPLYPHSS